MPKIKFQNLKFQEPTIAKIAKCNEIIAEYSRQGFQLTVRQLYYQLVSRGFIQNHQKEYRRVQDMVSNARLAGLIDWSAIEDRTRNLDSLPHWDSPAIMVEECAEQFHVDMWEGQEARPEVWIEKDALVGIIEAPCRHFDVSFFSCRGFTSLSELWVGAMRLKQAVQDGQRPIIFHLGDHDPSGIDMTRNIRDRLALFTGFDVKVVRLALNLSQVERYKPPPNTAKEADARYSNYLAEFGQESWELDALEPGVIDTLIRAAVRGLIDERKWRERNAEKKAGRERLRYMARLMAVR